MVNVDRGKVEVESAGFREKGQECRRIGTAGNGDEDGRAVAHAGVTEKSENLAQRFRPFAG